jgi:peptidoglycan/LPS O-acetylase OafA/YrhL
VVVAAQQSSTANRPRYQALDSLRGVCACGVALFHLHTPGFICNFPPVLQGWLFVDFFFVLSGFVIAASYGEALRRGFSLSAYLILRLGRIYPLHLFMLLAFVGLDLALLVTGVRGSAGREPFTGIRSLLFLAENLLLIQVFDPVGLYSWNGPSWSIAAEMWTYALTAVGLSLLKERFRWVLAAIIVLSPAILLMFGAEGLASRNLSLVRCLFGFSIGMLAFDLHHRLHIGAEPRRGLATAAEAAALVLCAAAMSSIAYPPLQLACPFLFALVILALAREKGAASELLKSAPLRRLGALSYSIYMVHALVIVLGMKVLGFVGQWLRTPLVTDGMFDGRLADSIGGAGADLLALGFLALIVAVASVTWRFVELPFRTASRRLAERIARRSVLAVERVAPTM